MLSIAYSWKSFTINLVRQAEKKALVFVHWKTFMDYKKLQKSEKLNSPLEILPYMVYTINPCETSHMQS